MTKHYIDLKKLKDKINIGFFTSNGGVSKRNFYSLNCGINTNDSKNNIKKNINIALSNLDLKNKKLILLNQIHSNKVFIVNQNNSKKKLYGDGLITKDRNLALGILTADCAPIFIFDSNNSIICALHSGWRGSLLNIVEKSILKLKNRKINLNKLIAVIGPCLGLKNFEVDSSFKFKFINKNKDYKKFFREKNKNKDLFDLRGIINFQLKKAGICKIYNIKKDTYKYSKKFYSYRRITQQNKIDTGRMINIISLKD